MPEGYLRPAEAGTLLALRVSPGAKRTGIDGPYGGAALKVRVCAPPVDGRANAELTRYLSRLLGLPRASVEVVRGGSGRDKTVLLRGAEIERVRGALSGADA